MRLIECLYALVVLSLAVGTTGTALSSIRRVAQETARQSRSLERDRFLVRSFRQLCAQGETDDFARWQVMCRSLWSLEDTEIRTVGRDSDGNMVFVCSWKTEQGKRNVFATGVGK